MARCYICDASPGNGSLFRVSETRPSVTYREDPSGKGYWICSECETQDESDEPDQTDSEEDGRDAPQVPTAVSVRTVP